MGVESGEPESSDSLRTFGAVVQGLREHHGLSREELGDVVGFSKHTVASVELGRRMPDEEFVEAAELALGNTGALRRAAGFVERQTGLAAWFQRWARLETTAITLYVYESRMVPGLLQTEAYARHLFTEKLPPLADEQIEANWAARAKRQLLLRERPNTKFGFILEEHALRRRTGGAEVAREAIDHLLAMSDRRNLDIQIMPMVCESHPGLGGPLQLLETPNHKWFAYCEGQRGGLLVSEPKEVSILHMRYARMLSQALRPDESRSLLRQIRGDL
ncbi:helix-turn-helix domain-containing protein [Streptomyces sp. NBC_00582]|uniref:helix-turn-helix domain-containing protein n=1 Tax=Streptomyces sp. NBC_00582 TaxID=2975783 RepID=UPI002E821BEE|nr:helix-turn-helix transcriptional regulator [Streptomyces sp. NBC_00582]WUB64965.1 helix-turn-helix transcriptional regulator [Streptomyces sp. NBC_00582]